MKKFTAIFFILLSLSLSAASPSTMEERGLWERFLIRMKIREDTAKSFKYSKLRVYSRKSGVRRMQARVKNDGSGDFHWATFKLMLGERSDNLEEVYRFTINNFEKNKTYFFDSDVDVNGVKGKKLEVVYVDSEMRK